jgi:branched-chain amino acid transport system substrate-binding protein
VVHGDGGIHEADGAAGRRLLEASPELVRYAVALLQSERRSVSFFWSDPSSGAWRRVSIERSASVGDGEAAVVTLEDEQLPFRLTGRELDVLTLLAGGLNNRQIATRLAAGVRTVATHVEHILGKLAQRSRAGASAVAVDRGLLRLPIPGGSGLEGLTVGMLHELSEAAGAAAGRRTLPGRWVRRPLLIGSALPLTGPARGDGAEMRNGTALAIGEINARGGVGGRVLEHVVVPTDIFDEHSIRAAFDTLMSAEVDAITSLYLFDEDAAMDAAAEYGAPFLHATTSEHMAERTRADPGRYSGVFQVCPSEVHYGRGFVRFLDEGVASGAWRPHSRSVLFVETSLQSSQIATADTLETTERSGWKVAGVHHVAAENADWSGVVDVIQRTDPGAILVTDFLPTELAGFQRAFTAAPTEALVYAVYSPSVPEFLQLAGDAAEGLVWSTATGTYGDHVGQAFMSRYARTFGQRPGRSHAGIAYDEVHLLAQAWASVENPRDFRIVADRLRRATHRGVNGSYSLDNARQSGLAYPDMTRDPSLSQAHLVLQVQGGQHRILSPPPYVEASFRPPPWFPADRVSA